MLRHLIAPPGSPGTWQFGFQLGTYLQKSRKFHQKFLKQVPYLIPTHSTQTIILLYLLGGFIFFNNRKISFPILNLYKHVLRPDIPMGFGIFNDPLRPGKYGKSENWFFKFFSLWSSARGLMRVKLTRYFDDRANAAWNLKTSEWREILEFDFYHFPPLLWLSGLCLLIFFFCFSVRNLEGITKGLKTV